MPRTPIYLDYHATTPVDRRVLERMLPYFTETFGNPASASHQWGWRAQDAVEQARREVAALVGAAAKEIYFTSGATESNNLAIQGVCAVAEPGRRHLVVSAIEHKSILEGVQAMVPRGFRVTVVPVGRDGVIDLEALRAAVTAETALVSVMAANNEIGVIQPVAEVGAIARAAGAVFHVDAAQAVGKIPIDVSTMQIDLLSLTAHKMYGPKGEGAIFVRKRLKIAPILIGGGQERGMRSGTLNVPGIVGLGAACALCGDEMQAEGERLRRLRDHLLAGLRAGLDDVVVNGSIDARLPQNLHVSFLGVDGESLLVSVGDIAVSTGSACASSTGEPSHVLQALMGRDAVPPAAIRFGLGRYTTADDIDYTIEKFTSVVRHLRATSPAR